MPGQYGILAVLVGGPYDGQEVRLPDARWLFVPVVPPGAAREPALVGAEPRVSRWLPVTVEREVYEQVRFRDRVPLDNQGRARYRYRGRWW